MPRIAIFANIDKWIFLLALVFTATIGLAGLNPYLLNGGDNAGYIAQAEGWLKLGRFANLYLIGVPVSDLKPPLFPLLLAAVEMVFGRNVSAFKAMNVLFAVASVWMAWCVLRVGLESPSDELQPIAKQNRSALELAGLAFWFAITPSLTFYSHEVLSDIPFTFFTLAVIFFCARAARPQASLLNLLAVACALLLATELRAAGIIVAGACAGYLSRNAE